MGFFWKRSRKARKQATTKGQPETATSVRGPLKPDHNKKLATALPVQQLSPSPTTTSSGGSSEDNGSQTQTQNQSTNTFDWNSLATWNDASVAQVAEWWKLSEKDVAKLWHLQQKLADVDHPLNQPNQVIRYYRDAHGNITKAEQKFRRMIAWRIEEQVDALTDDYVPPHPLLSEYLPTTVLDQYDRDGDPIWLERIGVCDSLGLFTAFGLDDLLKYAVWIRESCIKGDWAEEYRARNGGKPPMRATAIIDLEGMGWDHLKPSLLPLLKEGLVIVQNYYCGFGKKVIVIRTSRLFPIIWKVAQHFVGENLRNMMVFANADDYLDVLEEYIELENLPPCLYPDGGKGRGGVGMPNHLDGGKVPSLKELDQIWAKRQHHQQQAEAQQQKPNKHKIDRGSSSMSTSATSSYDSDSTMTPSTSTVGTACKSLGGGSFNFTTAQNIRVEILSW